MSDRYGLLLRVGAALTLTLICYPTLALSCASAHVTVFRFQMIKSWIPENKGSEIEKTYLGEGDSAFVFRLLNKALATSLLMKEYKTPELAKHDEEALPLLGSLLRGSGSFEVVEVVYREKSKLYLSDVQGTPLRQLAWAEYRSRGSAGFESIVQRYEDALIVLEARLRTIGIEPLLLGRKGDLPSVLMFSIGRPDGTRLFFNVNWSQIILSPSGLMTIVDPV